MEGGNSDMMYVVQSGDTLQGIALRHNMKVSDLKYLNHLFGGSIYTGQILQVEPRNRKRCTSEPRVRNVDVVDSSCSTGDAQLNRLRSTEMLSIPVADLLSPTAESLKYQASSPRKRPLDHIEFGPMAPPIRRSSSKGCSMEDPVEEDSERSSEDTPPKALSRSSSEKNASFRNLLANAPLPKLIGCSSTEILADPNLSKTLVQQLENVLPRHCRGYDWKLIYSLPQHGASLSTFYRKAHKHSPTILVVEDDRMEVFGCFASKPWRLSQSYYGSGECFLFSTYPEFAQYSWSAAGNSMFMFSSEDTLAMGGGGGFGLFLNSDFSQGSSQYSETFQNRCLASSEDFEVVSVELWGLVTKR